MTPAIGLAAVGLFALALRLLKVAEMARASFAHSRAAMSVLMDGGKTEAEKETAARAAGLALFAGAFKITAGVGAALLVPAALVAGAASAGLTSLGNLTAALSSPWMLAAACALSVPAFIPR